MLLLHHGHHRRSLSSHTRSAQPPLYRTQCEPEISSTFAFRANKWLSDIAPQLLSESQRTRLLLAKRKAAKRETIESAIPTHLLYVNGWPTAIPTFQEATLIAETRRRIAEVMEIDVKHTTALSVSNRYAELLRQKNEKAGARKQRNKTTQINSQITPNHSSAPTLFHLL